MAPRFLGGLGGEAHQNLDALIQEVGRLVRLSMDRAVDGAVPAGGKHGLEEQLRQKLQAVPKERMEAIRAKARGRLRATPDEQRKYYGTFARCSNRNEGNLESNAREAGSDPAIRSLVKRFWNQGKGRPAEDIGVGRLLNDECLARKERPVAVELWATRITCVNDFDREAGKDEIFIGAVTHDIYNGRDTMTAPVKVGEFNRKDRGKSRAINIKLGSMPIGPGLWRDALYFATLYLGEKDLGGMKRFMEKDGLSSYEFFELTALMYVTGLSSLMGSSLAGDDGFDGKRLLGAMASGLGGLFVANRVTAAASPLSGLATAIVEAVIGALVHAVADDMFPPQVVPFHLFVPPGKPLDTLNVAGAAPFRYTQELLRGENVARYDVEYEWRVTVAPAADADLVIPKATEAASAAEALRNLDKIEHIVVVMLENRSFDQMLGFLTADRGRTDLQDPVTREHFNVLFKENINSAKSAGTPDLTDIDHPIHVRPLADTWLEEDPGHSIQAVARQVLGAILPNAEGAGVSGSEDPHWPTEEQLAALRKDTGLAFLPAKMKGFARDYFVTLQHRGNLVTQRSPQVPGPEDVPALVAQVGDIMGYHTATHLPTYDLFATEFAVCDRWFSSFPGNTWVNRTISLTGAPARQLNPNKDGRSATGEHVAHVHWIVNNDMPFDERSFFHVLDGETYKGKPIQWAFYSQDMPSLLLVDASYASELKNRVEGQPNRLRSLGRFFKDAEEGRLPHVSWVDPNFMDIGQMSDNLFGWDPQKDTDGYFTGHLVDVNHANDDHPPVDVSHGQSFLLAIFRALMQSPQWEKTMLIVTYDEHGGFHDHVPPPPNETFAPEPVSLAESPAFVSLGARVPAMVVSPWVDRQLVSHMQFDHTSIIKTILTKFCRSASGAVSPRVTNANHLGWLLNAKEARFVQRAPVADKKKSARGPMLTNLAEGLATLMAIRRGGDGRRNQGVRREPTDLQRQVHEGRKEILARTFKGKARPAGR